MASENFATLELKFATRFLGQWPRIWAFWSETGPISRSAVLIDFSDVTAVTMAWTWGNFERVAEFFFFAVGNHSTSVTVCYDSDPGREAVGEWSSLQSGQRRPVLRIASS